MTESINVFTNKHGRRYYTIGKSYVKYDIEFSLEDALVMKDTQLKRYTCVSCGVQTFDPDKDEFMLFNSMDSYTNSTSFRNTLNSYRNPMYSICYACFEANNGNMCNYMDESNAKKYATTDDNGRFCLGPEHCLNCNYNMVEGIFISPCRTCVKYCTRTVQTIPIGNKKIGLDDWNKNDEYVPYEENGRIYKKIHKRFTDDEEDGIESNELETDNDLPELVSCYSESSWDENEPSDETKRDYDEEHYSCPRIASDESDYSIGMEGYDDDTHSVNSNYNEYSPIFPL
jgi:hypothetical protein